MQLNTLNRVISLFLIGGFVIVLATASLTTQISGFLKLHPVDSSWGPAAGVFLAVGLLSVTALAGTIVDAVGNLTVRKVIRRWLGKRRLGSRLFLCGSEFNETQRWKGIFEEALNSSPRYKSLADSRDVFNSFSAVLFFRTAEKEHAEWLIQHHSIYHLSADFVVILAGLCVFLWTRGLLISAALSLLCAYLLTTFALDNYLYTYQISFRNAYIAIREGDTPGPLKPTENARRRSD